MEKELRFRRFLAIRGILRKPLIFPAGKCYIWSFLSSSPQNRSIMDFAFLRGTLLPVSVTSPRVFVCYKKAHRSRRPFCPIRLASPLELFCRKEANPPWRATSRWFLAPHRERHIGTLQASSYETSIRPTSGSPDSDRVILESLVAFTNETGLLEGL